MQERNWREHLIVDRHKISDLVLVVCLGLVVLAGASYFDLTERAFEASRALERFELDEFVLVLLLTPGLALLYQVMLLRRARGSAIDSKRLYSEIIAATPHLVAIENEAGQLLDINPAGRRLHGIPNDHSGMRMLDLFAPGSREQIMNEALPAAREEGVWSGYSARIACDGSEIPTSEVIICHRDAAGDVTHFSYLSRDLRERQTYEDRLRQKQRLESVGHLAGGVAHQFNNLLMIIIGYASRAKKAKDSEAAQASLAQVLKAANTAAGMTRELLIFSRRDGSEKQVISVSEAIDSMVTLFRPLVGEYCQLHCQINHEDTWVEADPDNLSQAIMNLVTNARDAMPEGGRIEVSVDWHAGKSDHEPTYGTMADGIYVMVSVRDQGLGMTKETLDRIFEPFFTTKAVGQGTGLGLPVVLGFIEACGGALDVESKPGHGTVFRLYLPAAQRIIETADAKTEALDAQAGATILLVDDQDELRSLLRETLAELGYNVLEARDGKTAQAIESSYDETIDLLLTDIVMPGMNGIDLSFALSERNPLLKTVFLTGYPGRAGDGMLTPPEGAVVLHKPVATETLARTLKAALAVPGQGSSDTARQAAAGD